MSEALRLRSLLTDTLPYEVPVIFSNDQFHASLSVKPPAHLEEWLTRLRDYSQSQYTVPYNYEIAKDEDRTTTLSVIHPLSQIRFAAFYDQHSGSILNFCAADSVSLRRPVALASPFSEGPIESDDGRLRLGVVQRLADAGEPDVSHLVSYFSYGKYNLLGKFIASREFTRLETRYRRYRSIDITKCFYNIYTHSITWAVKDKDFSKINSSHYSFESAFDVLMQRCNYNETNGIVVGPEFSRIFAEIILQSVDAHLSSDLDSRDLKIGYDYEIRRYVDDYYVFANSDEVLDRVESCLRSRLAEYKLYVNDKKVETHRRPFVSQLSLARDEASHVVRSVFSSIREMARSPEEALTSGRIKELAASIRSIRLIVAKYDVKYANISGWLMSRLKAVLRRCLKAAKEFQNADHRQSILDVVILVLEVALYVCAIDLRVRTTYSVSQIALLIRKERDLFSPEQDDLLDHLLMDECGAILRAAQSRIANELGSRDHVELYNLLICGAEFVGSDFVHSKRATDLMAAMMQSEEVTYFAFISLKFCFLKDPVYFRDQLAALNDRVERRIIEAKPRIKQNTQEYLMLCDFLSSPDIDRNRKRLLYTRIFGGQISNADVEEVAGYIGFVDWTGLSVEHLLKRKELRPVYAWG